MASISNDVGGVRRILFFDENGVRRTLRLGRCNRRHAETVRSHVEHIVSSKTLRAAVPPETASWLAELDDTFIDRLANVGLVPRRESATLGPWVEKYIAGRTDLKPASLVKLRQTQSLLLSQFDSDTPLRNINFDQAADWRQATLAKGLSEATVRLHCRNVKAIFNAAVKRDLIGKSPVENLVSSSVSADNTRYVTPEEAQRIIDACPSKQWALLFGLARYAGLRTPSETHTLTWKNVDLARGRMTVKSPKTERHLGHEERVVPITPKLAALLWAAYEEADSGQILVVTLSKNNMARKLQDIIQDAGVAEWDGLYQNLRRSCEIEWAQTFPQFAVSKWIGHSITVSGRHYANMVPDELFERMAGGGCVAQKAAQQTSETTCNEEKTQNSEPPENASNPEESLVSCDSGNPGDGIRTHDQGIMSPRL